MEDNEIKEQFEEIYKSKIRPHALRLEPYRLEQKKKSDVCTNFYMILLVLFICNIVMMIIGGKINNPQLISISIIIFFSCILAFIVTNRIQTKILSEYRQTIKPILLKPVLSIFGDFRTTNNEILSLEEIKSMGLYYKAGSKKDDDIIIGEYKNSPITLFETKLTHTERRNKSRSTITDFEGLVIKVKVNKDFKGTTVASQEITYDNQIKTMKEMAKKHPDLFSPSYAKILDNGLVKNATNIDNVMTTLDIIDGELDVSLRLNINKPRKNLRRVHIDDSEFDKNYDIYSNNQEEVCYLITPSFIEKLKFIQSVFIVYSVDFVFKEGFLYLFLNGSSSILDTINTKKIAKKYKIKALFAVDNGFFEVGNIYTPLSDKEIFNDLFKELSSIFSLVDCLIDDEKDKL